MNFNKKYGCLTYGMNIPIQNLSNGIRRGAFKTESELIAAIDLCKRILDEEKGGLIELFNNLCVDEDHDFAPTKYTCQSRIMGNYVYVYERVCKICYFKDSFQINTESEDDKPSWTEGAKEMHYNNGF